MKSTDKPNPKEPRHLSVQPDDAAKVKGGWSIRIPPLTTPTTSTTTSIKKPDIEGESIDSRRTSD